MNRVPPSTDKGKDPIENKNTENTPSRKPSQNDFPGHRKIETGENGGNLQRITSKSEIIEELKEELVKRNAYCTTLEKKNLSLTQQLEYFNLFAELKEPNGGSKKMEKSNADKEDDKEILDLVMKENERLLNEYNKLRLKHVSLRENCIQKNQMAGKKLNPLKNDLEEIRSEQKMKFEEGAEERQLKRISDLDRKLEDSYKTNFRLKLGIFCLSAGIIGFAAYRNLPIVQEISQEVLKSIKSLDLNKIQQFIKTDFMNSINTLHYYFKELVGMLKYADRNYWLMVSRNLSIFFFGLRIMISLINNFSKILKKIYEWRGPINFLIAIGLIVFFSNNQKHTK